MTDDEQRSHLATAAGLRQGAMRLTRRMRAVRSPGALSANKLGVLSHLLRQGPSTASEVGAAEHQQPQSLTRVFAELEADGLITRQRDEQDKRQHILVLTEQGRAALTRDVGERDAWLASAMAGLSETEREVLHLAGKLMDQLADTN
ncbi:MarR family winged helix-turn-helix transcriptional regulator [Amycolatopsis sp. cg5]|uniref:MarR family winged helix-turn-helix transcriptional regulator n=1 Tax=Amycolatopsis sp. cg5 TaxID=3238802 RepID=UPI003524C3BF